MVKSILQYVFLPVAALFICMNPSGARAGGHDEKITLELTGHIGDLYHITTREGSEFYGKAMGINEMSGEAVFESGDLGRVLVSVPRIKDAERLSAEAATTGEYWFSNPGRTRYFLSPNAIPLKKNQGYYQNTDLLINSFNIGVTDRVSVGAGFEFISLFMRRPLYFVMPKIGFQAAESVYLGGGLLYAAIADTSASHQAFNLAYGLATYGNADTNVTIGLGYGVTGDEFAGRPVVAVSGAVRISERVGLISENWFFQDFSLFSDGVRFMGKKVSVDLALVNNKEISRELHVGFPFVDFMVPF